MSDSLNLQWENAPFEGVKVVIHAAARVHVMHDETANPLAAYRSVNVDWTLNLARHAAAAGVRRFIFISSIKVNGEATRLGCVYRADDVPAPVDPYGVSKLEAERGLQRLALETGMEVVVIRPVLVYGPGVKANFLSMMRWIDRGIPLPLASVTFNRRSFVALDNLVDLVFTCIHHPKAGNQIFLVCDGEDLSTAALVVRLAKALGRPARLFAFPVWILNLTARLFGRGAAVQRLCGSLQVDISKTRDLLGWKPPLSADQALLKTAQHYLKANS